MWPDEVERRMSLLWLSLIGKRLEITVRYANEGEASDDRLIVRCMGTETHGTETFAVLRLMAGGLTTEKVLYVRISSMVSVVARLTDQEVENIYGTGRQDSSL